MPRLSTRAASDKDTSRISITAHHTAYTWYANHLSHPTFATPMGKFLYLSCKPWMFLGRTVLGVSDLESALLQRHLILDYLLEDAIKNSGVGQVVELACGLSPRGFRFANNPAYKDLLYVEADLPDMALRKNNLLKKGGLVGKNHKVVPCNILTETGDQSLEEIVGKHLDPSKPTAIITEGLINYFDRETMENLWRRMASLLASGAGGVYLSDNMPHPTGHPYGFVVKSWNQIVRTIARGGFYMHFTSDQDAEERFRSLGFSQAKSMTPESFRDRIPVPVSRYPSFVRVIQARV